MVTFRAGKVDMATTWSFDILIRPLPLMPIWDASPSNLDNAWSKADHRHGWFDRNGDGPNLHFEYPRQRASEQTRRESLAIHRPRPLRIANPPGFKQEAKAMGTTRHGRCCRPSQRAVIRTRVGVSCPC